MEIFADGQSLGTDSDWSNPTTYLVPGNTRVLSVAGENTKGVFRGILGSTSNGEMTNETWKCSSVLSPGWNSPDFDDQDWPFARVEDHPWGTIRGIEETAKWIWANNNDDNNNNNNEDAVYCRLKLQ